MRMMALPLFNTSSEQVYVDELRNAPDVTAVVAFALQTTNLTALNRYVYAVLPIPILRLMPDCPSHVRLAA